MAGCRQRGEGTLRHAMAMVRATALLTLLAGCSDDGDDKPSGDAGMDGGLLDACVPASIAGCRTELAEALKF